MPKPRAVFFARLAILVERAAPVAVLAGAPIALIVIASLFDLWAFVPRWAHWLALLAAAAAAAGLTLRKRPRRLWPQRAEALARLEKDGRVRHEALQALEDSPIGGGPLWDAHLAEMRERARAARLRGPRATAHGVDPHGARYAVLALLVVGWIAAEGAAGDRLSAGLFPADPRARQPGFADLWIEPPAYTGKAPIYLLRAGDALPGDRAAIEAPKGSIAHSQADSGRHRLSLRAGDRTLIGAREGARAKLALDHSGRLVLQAGGRVGRWPIEIIDDRPPQVAWLEDPRTDADGRLVVSVKIDDDYGATSAQLRLRLDPEQPRPQDAPGIGDRAKGETRLIDLPGASGSGARTAALDLQSDPWAGLAVSADVVARDAAGQTGATSAVKTTLPAKSFFNPLARAVIEQRQSLALAPDAWRRVEWAFGGLTLGPEYFFERPSDYLLLRTAMWRVNKVAGGDYRPTVEAFWPLALQLEDETLELARRRLEAAKSALKEALDSGAADSEIERLTEELRAALQQYLQELAQSDGVEDGSVPTADQIISAADLDEMLNSVRDLAKSGAGDAARQALAELEHLLDNLRIAGAGGRPSGQGGSAGEAGDLIGRQRELADKNFERGRQPGAAGNDLADEQSAIASDLSALLNSPALKQGLPSADSAERALADALDQMRASEEALRGEDFDAAGAAMERAIASLREGAGELARGEAERAARVGRGGAAAGMRDPLGRPVGEAYGAGVDVPEKSDAQRTRELIEELRRRLSEGGRSENERKYLERLLERF